MVDTPGFEVNIDLSVSLYNIHFNFKDSKDAEFVEELSTVLGNTIPEIDSFLITYKYKVELI